MSAEEHEPGVTGSTQAGWYSYAIIRIVPRIERGEFVNVGVILFARTQSFLVARTVIDQDRLRAVAPHIVVPPIVRHLEAMEAIAAGSDRGGPMASQSPSERFHWLTSPRSTVVQTSPIHVGCCHDPAAALEELLDAFVRLPLSP